MGLSADVVELRHEVASLRAHVAVLNEVFGGIREELQWITQNGFPLREPIEFVRQIPVLRAIALDPIGDHLGEQLDIDHAWIATTPDAATSVPAESIAPTSTSLEPLPKTADKPAPPRPRDRLFWFLPPVPREQLQLPQTDQHLKLLDETRGDVKRCMTLA